MNNTVATTSVARAAFLDALGRVALVVPRGKASLPVVSMVRIEGIPGRLRLTGTDFDRTVTTTVEASDAEEFPTRVVPCHRLVAIVSQLPIGPVDITPTANGVRITAKRARFDVTGLPADEFPNGDSVGDAETSLELDAPTFTTALTRASTCCSHETSRPTMGGVHVKAGVGGELTLEGCDGIQLAREWVPRSSGPALDIIIPADAVPVIAKLFADAERLTLGLRGLRAVIASDTDGLTMEMRLVEGPYPETAHVINREIPHSATVDRVELLAAVKRVAAVSPNEKLKIRMDWNADSVTVSGVGDDDVGTSEDSVPCTMESGAPLRVTFAPRLLADALALREAGTVHIGLRNADTQMTLRDEGSALVQNLVMPLRDLGR